MPSSRRARSCAVVTVTALGLLGLGACGAATPSADPSVTTSTTPAKHPGPGPRTTTPVVITAPAPTSTAPPVVTTSVPPMPITGLPVPRDLEQEFSTLLDRRAAALQTGDQAAFTAGLAAGDAAFVQAQLGYFANLRQLPIQSLGYHIEPTSLVRSGRSYTVVVDVALQLAGVDAVPVTTVDRYRFTSSGPTGTYLLTAAGDPVWQRAHGYQPQPWDTEPVVVRHRHGVVGVFDARTAPAASDLMAGFVQGADSVRGQVPYGWSGAVIFYALADDAFVDGLGSTPGSDPALLDGVAFTVPASSTDPTVASIRVVLNERVLRAGRIRRDRLIRHELTHVAIGAHDANAPTWLTEGLCEWVSVQAIPRDEQKIAPAAVTAAESGGVAMAPDETFNGADVAVNYALAWWAVEYVALKGGPSAPWALLDAFAQPGGDPAVTTVLATGHSPDQLARKAASLIRRVYGTPSTTSDGGTSTATPTETPSD